MNNTSVKEAAIQYTKAGLHVVPIRGDGSKKVALAKWKEYEERPATLEEIEQWYDGKQEKGVAILGGNDLEILDIELHELYLQFAALVEPKAPGLLQRLPRVATPRGGSHLYYLCDEVAPNEKLARAEDKKTLIETRGIGGYVVAPPSPACCHLANKPYVHVEGPDLLSIPRISVAERCLLLDAARTLNRYEPKTKKSRKLTVGEAYIDQAELARSGHGGHDTTFGVARYLVNELGLPRDEARVLLDRYNERLKEAGGEPWTSRELDHKLDSVNSGRHDAGRIDDPHRLATSFFATRPWVFWHGRHFEYAATKYVEVPDYEVNALLTKHVRETLEENRREQIRRGDEPSRKLTVGRSLVRNTLQALEALSLLRGSESLQSRLSGNPATNLLAFTNGLFDLNSFDLSGHTRDWFSLVCLPYAYDPDANCPIWLKVLDQNLEGDEERIALLQEFFGYTLMNTTDAQRFLFLAGEGANGKSVVLAALHAMLGPDNISTVPLEDFGKRFAMAQTLGKFANISPEVGELDRTAEGTLKAFVSGDRMTFERKGKDAFSARPTARLVLSTNNTPRFSDKSDGVWRRLILVPFTRQVPIHERVAGMDKPEFWLKANEAAGILNWALDGLRRLQSNGMRFTESAICRAALQEHRVDSDPCRAFLEEHYVADQQGKPIPASDLYGKYKDWAEANGFKVVSSNNFGRQVRRVFGLDTKSYRFAMSVQKAWIGLAWRTLAA